MSSSSCKNAIVLQNGKNAKCAPAHARNTVHVLCEYPALERIRTWNLGIIWIYPDQMDE